MNKPLQTAERARHVKIAQSIRLTIEATQPFKKILIPFKNTSKKQEPIKAT